MCKVAGETRDDGKEEPIFDRHFTRYTGQVGSEKIKRRKPQGNDPNPNAQPFRTHHPKGHCPKPDAHQRTEDQDFQILALEMVAVIPQVCGVDDHHDWQ